MKTNSTPKKPAMVSSLNLGSVLSPATTIQLNENLNKEESKSNSGMSNLT
jgi:hypothetical protein